VSDSRARSCVPRSPRAPLPPAGDAVPDRPPSGRRDRGDPCPDPGVAGPWYDGPPPPPPPAGPKPWSWSATLARSARTPSPAAKASEAKDTGVPRPESKGAGLRPAGVPPPRAAPPSRFWIHLCGYRACRRRRRRRRPWAQCGQVEGKWRGGEVRPLPSLACRSGRAQRGRAERGQAECGQGEGPVLRRVGWLAGWLAGWHEGRRQQAGEGVQPGRKPVNLSPPAPNARLVHVEIDEGRPYYGAQPGRTDAQASRGDVRRNLDQKGIEVSMIAYYGGLARHQ
jgi:hypothetical protein